MPCEDLFFLALEVYPVAHKVVPSAKVSPVLGCIRGPVWAEHGSHLLGICTAIHEVTVRLITSSRIGSDVHGLRLAFYEVDVLPCTREAIATQHQMIMITRCIANIGL